MHRFARRCPSQRGRAPRKAVPPQSGPAQRPVNCEARRGALTERGEQREGHDYRLPLGEQPAVGLNRAELLVLELTSYEPVSELARFDVEGRDISGHLVPAFVPEDDLQDAVGRVVGTGPDQHDEVGRDRYWRDVPAQASRT